jgi:hypothetical protein
VFYGQIATKVIVSPHFIAALLFAVHGIVDVSGHWGTAFAAVFLLGLSLHRPLSLKTSQCISILFRFVGLVLLAWDCHSGETLPYPGLPIGVVSR